MPQIHRSATLWTPFLELAISIVASGCAGSGPETRIIFPATSVNGQPARAVMDTGATTSSYFSSGAKQMGVKYSTSQSSYAFSDPAQISFGRETFNLQLMVYVQPWYIGRGNTENIDFIVGWPEFRNNILVFSNIHHRVRSVPELPAETTGWLKLKVTRDPILFLETPLPDGQTGQIFVDTGMPGGVSLNQTLWKSWRAAHPNAPSRQGTAFSPGLGTINSEQAWADEITLGALTLTDLPVGHTDPPKSFKSSNFLGTIGMYALERMDLIVDGKNGFAYLHPKPPPGPPYPSIARPGIKSDPAQGAAVDNNWTVDDSVRLNFAPLWADVANQKKLRGNLHGALADANHALELDPQNAQALVVRGDIKDDQNDPDGALADYNLALHFDPKNDVAYFNRGLIKYKRGDFDGAISDYSHDLELDPRDTDAYLNRGGAKSAKHDFDGATADFTRALELDPKEPHAYGGRGSIKFETGDYAGAVADYDRFIELSPKDPEAYFRRAMARQIQGDLKGALADYDKAIALKPDDPAYAHLYRHIVQVQLGQHPTQFAASVAGWKDGWTKTLGQFLVGKLDEPALLAAAQIKDQEPVNGQLCEAYYVIGEMRLFKGDQAGARDFFQKSIATAEKNYHEYQFARAELVRLDNSSAK